MEENIRQLPGRVYCVSSLKDETVLVGMEVRIHDDTISWFDSIKERRMRIANVITDTPELFVFERAKEEGGGMYSFAPLTLTLFNQKVKTRIFEAPNFVSEEEMLCAFEKSLRSAW